ncbi:hypothetical protein F511_45127 [Dorcoceras hygrometricum]|uniref:Uncharacterized protein n=1 Tax=Dorcoceras hygrometricum TaxID=472368 RepID=A0A2Z7A4K1_9LAMI|nr:hypothetical protein F511_45127 [Dorcoceras hygrometricum]
MLCDVKMNTIQHSIFVYGSSDINILLGIRIRTPAGSGRTINFNRDAINTNNNNQCINIHKKRQSGPRPDPRFLRQTALEVLTRSARSDSPRKVGRKPISGEVAAAARKKRGGGGA